MACSFKQYVKIVKTCMVNLKAHQQIFPKQCFEKYCSYNKAFQFLALQGTLWWSYLEDLTIDYKFITKQVPLFIRQTTSLKHVDKKKLLGCHNKVGVSNYCKNF